jgi:hypothetical protein
MIHRYGYSVYTSWHRFYASGKVRRLHTYGAHTAYGKRTVWKECAWHSLGSFDTRAEAVAAGKAWVQMKKDQHAKETETRH